MLLLKFLHGASFEIPSESLFFHFIINASEMDPPGLLPGNYSETSTIIPPGDPSEISTGVFFLTNLLNIRPR